MIIFTHPQYLVLLFSIPILIFVHILSLRSVKKKSIKFVNFDAIKRIRGVEVFSKNLTILYISMIMVVLIIFSISGMSITRQATASDLSFILVIDASMSMGSVDIFPSRIDAAKEAAINFLEMIPEKTKLGIVSFSGSAFIEQELTEDKQMIKNSIGNVNIKSVGGTDIFEAITTSVNMLRGEEGKTIILISDGQANINAIQNIVDYSNKNNVMIHSLGVGTKEGVEGKSGAVFKISEDSLRTIAEKTEGRYYNIDEVEDFYSSLNEIIDVTEKRAVYSLSLYLMISVLVLFIIDFILINTRYRILP